MKKIFIFEIEKIFSFFRINVRSLFEVNMFWWCHLIRCRKWFILTRGKFLRVQHVQTDTSDGQLSTMIRKLLVDGRKIRVSYHDMQPSEKKKEKSCKNLGMCRRTSLRFLADKVVDARLTGQRSAEFWRRNHAVLVRNIGNLRQATQQWTLRIVREESGQQGHSVSRGAFTLKKKTSKIVSSTAAQWNRTVKQ